MNKEDLIDRLARGEGEEDKDLRRLLCAVHSKGNPHRGPQSWAILIHLQKIFLNENGPSSDSLPAFLRIFADCFDTLEQCEAQLTLKPLDLDKLVCNLLTRQIDIWHSQSFIGDWSIFIDAIERMFQRAQNFGRKIVEKSVERRLNRLSIGKPTLGGFADTLLPLLLSEEKSPTFVNIVVSLQFNLIRLAFCSNRQAAAGHSAVFCDLNAAAINVLSKEGGLGFWMPKFPDSGAMKKQQAHLWWFCHQSLSSTKNANRNGLKELCLLDLTMWKSFQPVLDESILLSKGTLSFYSNLLALDSSYIKRYLRDLVATMQSSPISDLMIVKFGKLGIDFSSNLHPLATLSLIMESRDYSKTIKRPSLSSDNPSKALREEFWKNFQNFSHSLTMDIKSNKMVDDLEGVSSLLESIWRAICVYFGKSEHQLTSLFLVRSYFGIYEVCRRDSFLNSTFSHLEWTFHNGTRPSAEQLIYFIGTSLAKAGRYIESDRFLSLITSNSEVPSLLLFKIFELHSRVSRLADMPTKHSLDLLSQAIDLYYNGQDPADSLNSFDVSIDNDSNQSIDVRPILTRWCHLAFSMDVSDIHLPKSQASLAPLLGICHAQLSNTSKDKIRKVLRLLLATFSSTSDSISLIPIDLINECFLEIWIHDDLHMLIRLNKKVGPIGSFYRAYWTFLNGQKITWDILKLGCLSSKQIHRIACMLILGSQYKEVMDIGSYLASFYMNRFCGENKYNQECIENSEFRIINEISCELQRCQLLMADGVFEYEAFRSVLDRLSKISDQPSSEWKLLLTLECLEAMLKICIGYYGVLAEAKRLLRMAREAINERLPKHCTYHRSVFSRFSKITGSENLFAPSLLTIDPFAKFEESCCVENFKHLQKTLNNACGRRNIDYKQYIGQKYLETPIVLFKPEHVMMQVLQRLSAYPIDHAQRKPILYYDSQHDEMPEFAEEAELVEYIKLAFQLCSYHHVRRIVLLLAYLWPNYRWKQIKVARLAWLLEEVKSLEFRRQAEFYNSQKINSDWNSDSLLCYCKDLQTIHISVDEEHDYLYVCYIQKDNKTPLILRTHCGSSLEREKETLNSLMQVNRETLFPKDAAINERIDSAAYRKQWWTRRKSLDSQLCQYVNAFEGSWLPFYGHKLGILVDEISPAPSEIQIEEFRQSLQGSLFHFASFNRVVPKDLAAFILKSPIFGGGAKIGVLERIVDLIEGTLRVEISTMRAQFIRSLRKLLDCGKLISQDEQPNMFLAEQITAEATPILLVLDRRLHFIPWECTESFKGCSVYRIPSIWHIEQLNQSYNSFENDVSYLLNPSGDLKSTQCTFEPRLTSHPWRGIIARPPSSTEFLEALKSSRLFLYFGHGGGEMYIKGERLRKAFTESRQVKCAPSLLIGCSSGRLKEPEWAGFGVEGTVIDYLAAGSSCVLVNLWDVTDRDIDRLTCSMLERFGLWDVERKISKDLGLSLSQSRTDCLLSKINGAAPVIYGMPPFVWQSVKL